VLLRLPLAWPLSAGKEQTCAILAESCDGEQCVGRARCWGKDDAAQTRVFPDGTQPRRLPHKPTAHLHQFAAQLPAACSTKASQRSNVDRRMQVDEWRLMEAPVLRLSTNSG